MIESRSRVAVLGSRGLVGSALVRLLERSDFENVLAVDRTAADLTRPDEVDRLFDREKPEFVFLAAARVGGIEANRSFPADFIRENLQIQTAVIDAAWRHGVKKLLFLGSTCIYPREAEQPISEDSLLTGPLEPTNAPYAVAKIAGITMLQAYRQQHGFGGISLMPTNLYGPGDNFDPETSHVLPALIRKFHDAKTAGADTVTLWGTGTPRREFLHVDDLADAALFLMGNYDQADIVNVGTGEDIRIRELGELIAEVAGFEGTLRFDPERPDGAPRRRLDISRLRDLGWAPKIPLREGIEQTYRWYVDHVER